MGGRIRRPDDPRNPVPPPVPAEPAPVPADRVPPAGEADGPPAGVPTGNVPRGRIAGGGSWSAITRWRPQTWAAGRQHGVPWSMLEAMMVVESGGDPDARGAGGAGGLMQVKPAVWSRLAAGFGYDLGTPGGQIGMAAAILGGDVPDTRGMTPEQAFLRVYYPTPGLDVPGESGHTPRMYLEDIARYRRILEDAAGETPTTTAPPAAVDPLSAILGGRPVPAISYGWLADAGLDYYGYGVGHGTQRSTQHPAVDIPLPCGTPLFAPASGVVDCVGTAGTPRWGQACGAYADDGGGVGNLTILLDPGAVKLTLGHCRGADVRPGQRVAAGQRVGTVGDFNGCHVHVETSVRRADGSYQLVEPVAALAAVMRGATPVPDGPAPALEIVAAIADGAGGNRPRAKLLPGDLWVTVHETGNPNPSADALMHRRFVNEGGGPERVSFHFAVDDARAVQILPLDERGFHAGDGCDDPARDTGCFRSVAIETCVNAPAGSARWTKAKRNLAALVALIVADPGRFVGGDALAGRFAFERVAPHNRWSGKNCPARMLEEGSLPAVVAEARALAAGAGGGVGTEPDPAPRPDDLLLALFPAVDLSGRGVVSAAWLAARARDKRPYPFLRRHDAADGSSLWVFAPDLVLRSKGGKVTEVPG